MSDTEKAKKGLGRGLDALFQDEESLVEAALRVDGSADGRSVVGGLSTLPVGQLEPGESQPRFDFDEVALDTLAESIKLHGILQPLLVRPKAGFQEDDSVDFGRYEIIAGERRWRAAQRAQLHEVPVIVRTFEDEQALQIALIENLQRQDLNAVEEALGYQRLIEEYNYSHKMLSEALGKSRSHVTNMVRMLSLPDEVLAMLREGLLSPGHARTLIPLADPIPLAQRVVEHGMTVRTLEQHVRIRAKNEAGQALNFDDPLPPNYVPSAAELDERNRRVRPTVGEDAAGAVPGSASRSAAVEQEPVPDHWPDLDNVPGGRFFGSGRAAKPEREDQVLPGELEIIERGISAGIGLTCKLKLEPGKTDAGVVSIAFSNIDQFNLIYYPLCGLSPTGELDPRRLVD